MNYLGQHQTASIAAIRILVKVIGALGSKSEEELVALVRPATVVAGATEGAATLTASLAVGQDLGLLARDGQARICLGARFPETELVAASDDSREFRRLALAAVGQRALESVRSNEAASDLALGLTWLLSRNPLEPLSANHAGTTEALLQATAIDSIILNPTQWTGFRRWCTALGVADGLTTDSGRILQVAPGRVLASLHGAWSANRDASDFIRLVHTTCPILGHPDLVSALPKNARPEWQSSLGPTLSLGLVQMEQRGQVSLIAGEDAANAVRLEVGGVDVAIAGVSWLGVAPNDR